MLAWQQSLNQHWRQLRFGAATVETRAEQHFFEVQVYLDGWIPAPCE